MQAVIPETPSESEFGFRTPSVGQLLSLCWVSLVAVLLLTCSILAIGGPRQREEEDFVLNTTVTNNGDRMLKRRLDLGLSPDIQVANKFWLVNARLNISQLLS
jgi:hypothetical protein